MTSPERQTARYGEQRNDAPSGATPPDWQERLALRNWSLPVKLAAVLLVPTVFVISLGVLRIVEQTDKASSYDGVQQAVALEDRSSTLLRDLADERGAAAVYVASNRAGGPAAVSERVDVSRRSAADLRQASLGADSLDEQTRAAYRQAATELTQLDRLRTDVLAGRVDAPGAVTRYTEAVSALLTFDQSLTREAADPSVAGLSAGLYSLSLVREEDAFVRAVVASAVAGGRIDAPSIDQARNATLRRSIAVDDFRSAVGTDNGPLADAVVGADVNSRDLLAQVVLGRGSAGLPLQVSGPEWERASTAVEDRDTQVAEQLRTQLQGNAEALQQGARNAAGVASVVLLLALLAGGAVVFFVTRSLLRPLRLLRRTALDVAERRLPGAVKSLREGETPDTTIVPTPITTKEEIGQVARAFDQVHEQAVRLAAEQAGLRAAFNSIFVNLSRRSQALVERQLRLIEQLENNEEDPEALGNLFQLDHLATRMRRNSENLLVLSGTDLSRRNSRPVPLVDVLRAAASEVEQYQRIDLAPPPPVMLLGRTASDVVHLVAELLENASTFSAPETRVEIVATQGADGEVVVDIVDEGVGMSEEDLHEANNRLDSPPTVDVSASRRMGLFVVGRLATRHGIAVNLRSREETGVIASATIPAAAVLAAAPAGGPRPAQAAPERPALPAGPRTNGSSSHGPGDLPRPESRTNGHGPSSPSVPQGGGGGGGGGGGRPAPTPASSFFAPNVDPSEAGNGYAPPPPSREAPAPTRADAAPGGSDLPRRGPRGPVGPGGPGARPGGPADDGYGATDEPDAAASESDAAGGTTSENGRGPGRASGAAGLAGAGAAGLAGASAAGAWAASRSDDTDDDADDVEDDRTASVGSGAMDDDADDGVTVWRAPGPDDVADERAADDVDALTAEGADAAGRPDETPAAVDEPSGRHGMRPPFPPGPGAPGPWGPPGPPVRGGPPPGWRGPGTAPGMMPPGRGPGPYPGRNGPGQNGPGQNGPYPPGPGARGPVGPGAPGGPGMPPRYEGAPPPPMWNGAPVVPPPGPQAPGRPQGEEQVDELPADELPADDVAADGVSSDGFPADGSSDGVPADRFAGDGFSPDEVPDDEIPDDEPGDEIPDDGFSAGGSVDDGRDGGPADRDVPRSTDATGTTTPSPAPRDVAASDGSGPSPAPRPTRRPDAPRNAPLPLRPREPRPGAAAPVAGPGPDAGTGGPTPFAASAGPVPTGPEGAEPEVTDADPVGRAPVGSGGPFTGASPYGAGTNGSATNGNGTNGSHAPDDSDRTGGRVGNGRGTDGEAADGQGTNGHGTGTVDPAEGTSDGPLPRGLGRRRGPSGSPIVVPGTAPRLRPRRPADPAPVGVPGTDGAGQGGLFAPTGRPGPATNGAPPPARAVPERLPQRAGTASRERTPIFDEVASVWFREAPPSATGADESEWATTGDEGWRAAAASTETADAGTTESGLPKRRPRAQLVPGAARTASTPEAAPAAAGPTRRNADAIRGRLASYQQGVSDGRTSRRSPPVDTVGDEADSARPGSEEDQ